MITVYHTNESSAHAHAVFLYFMIPYYIEIDENIEMEGPPFCVKSSDEGVKFHVSWTYMCGIMHTWSAFADYSHTVRIQFQFLSFCKVCYSFIT